MKSHVESVGDFVNFLPASSDFFCKFAASVPKHAFLNGLYLFFMTKNVTRLLFVGLTTLLIGSVTYGYATASTKSGAVVRTDMENRLSQRKDTSDVRNLSLTDRGKLVSRTKFMTYGKKAIADTSSFTQSIYYASLNDNWRFKYFESQDKLPDGYEQVGFDDSEWSEVCLIPSKYRDSKDKILFVESAPQDDNVVADDMTADANVADTLDKAENVKGKEARAKKSKREKEEFVETVALADDAEPAVEKSDKGEVVADTRSAKSENKGGLATARYPEQKRADLKSIPDKIPVGVYRNTFIVPYDWDEREILLNIDRFGSAVTVWINGVKAGYAEDASIQAEFDITKLCNEDVNTIVVESWRYGKGTLVERTDNPRRDGLNGDVYIICQPKVRVSDILMTTTLDPSYENGMLQLGVVVKSHYLNPKELRVYYECLDADGKRLGYESKYTNLSMRLQDTVHFNLLVRDVQKWSAENPYLYTIKVSTQKSDGRFSEFINTHTGFRSVEVKGNDMLINGKPVTIKGVEMTEEVADDSLKVRLADLKSLGVNAVLTQPRPAEFYRYCDSLGIYVFDQANIESTVMGQSLMKGGSLANNPKWLPTFLYRTENMVQRDKAYPSVVAWSLGSLSGNGYNMYKAYMNLKTIDKSRPVCYDGAGLEWNTDIFFPSNPSLKMLKEWKSDADRPCVVERYDADMFDALWNLVDDGSSAVQGGFIGDTALKSDSLFRATVKKRFLPVAIAKGSVREEVVVTNRNDFASLDGYSMSWTLLDAGGKSVSSGIFDIDVPAGESASFKVLKDDRVLGAGEYTLRFTVEPKDAAFTGETLNLTL